MKTQNVIPCHPRSLLRHPRVGGDLVGTSSDQFSWDSRRSLSWTTIQGGNDGAEKGYLTWIASLRSQRRQKRVAWFTLVELIVVITILVILGTIAFVSLGGFSESARDGVRTTNASSLMKGLDVSYIRTGSYPLPDTSSINIMSGSTLIGYQWYVGSGIILRSKVSGDLSDPVDKTSFTYSVNVTQKKAQLLGFFESSTSLAFQTPFPIAQQATAATSDYSKRYPFVKGQSLGIILSNTGSTKNQPIQDVLTGSVDVGSGTVNAILSAYISSWVLVGTWVSGVIPAYVGSGSSLSGWAGTATIDFTNAGDYGLQNAVNLSVSGGSVSLTSGISATTWTRSVAAAWWGGKRFDIGLSFSGKLWRISNGAYLNDVWSSTDGITWTQVRANGAGGGFTGRYAGAVVVFNGKMWIMGGYNGSSYLNDVWSSTDGITWTQVLANNSSPGSNQFTQRETAGQTVVYNNKIWLMWGGYNTFLNDVWSSTDGITWTKVLTDTGTPGSSQFSRRCYGTSVVHNNKIWLMWGQIAGSAVTNDVWSSTDGITWTQTTSAAGWGTRQDTTAVSDGASMWLLGWDHGSTCLGSASRYCSDVWSSTDGVTWTQVTASASWAARSSIATATIWNGGLWMIGGGDGNSDVWYTTSAYPTSTIYTTVTTPTSQISTTGWAALSSITPTETLSSQTAYYALSFDGRTTWKTWDGSAWRSVTRNNAGTWQHNSSGTSTPSWTNCSTNAQEACISQSLGVLANQMNGTALSSLDQSKIQGAGGFAPWSTTTINLAIGLSTSSVSVTPSVDKVSFGYTQ